MGQAGLDTPSLLAFFPRLQVLHLTSAAFQEALPLNPNQSHAAGMNSGCSGSSYDCNPSKFKMIPVAVNYGSWYGIEGQTEVRHARRSLSGGESPQAS